MEIGPNKETKLLTGNKKPAKPQVAPTSGKQKFTIQRNFDAPTVAAIGSVVYVLSSVIHQMLGNALVCVVLHGHVSVISSVATESHIGMAAWAHRLMLASGTLANLAAGYIAYRLLPASRSKGGHVQYFVWLSMAVNLLTAGAYFTLPTLFGSGDWYQLLIGVPSAVIWRLVVMGLGIVIWIVTLRTVTPEFAPFLVAGDPNKQMLRARFLTIVPYALGGLIYCFAASINAIEMGMVWVTGAAISFGGTALLLIVPDRLRPDDFEGRRGNPPTIVRNVAWIVASIVLTMLFVGLLGPGVRF